MLCGMLLRLLPLITGFAPIFAVHVSYLIGIRAGVLRACIPYIEGCTSISATGRYPPASFLFKSVMMPEAILLALYWLFSVAWLRSLERSAGRSGNGGTTIAVFGVAGALFLIVYVTFLGTQGPVYDFMRRFGVYLYFLFTVVAQLILVAKGRRAHSFRARHTEPGFEGNTRGRRCVRKYHRVDICIAYAHLFLAELFRLAPDRI
jgi:hypothetical protein